MASHSLSRLFSGCPMLAHDLGVAGKTECSVLSVGALMLTVAGMRVRDLLSDNRRIAGTISGNDRRITFI